MKSSKELLIKTHLYLNNEIILHPNEGYDIDLMLPETAVRIFSNATIEEINNNENYFDGKIVLDNKCPHNTVQMSNKYWKKLGSPENVRLYYKDNKLLISNL